MTQCPLCGHEFDEGALSCHASCAFNKRCAILCCPNCGYQMVDESQSAVLNFLRRRRLKRRASQPIADQSGVLTLSDLQTGQKATVVAVADSGLGQRQERLSVFGIVPGALVTLRQRQPTFVLQVGLTDLSIERDIAEDILVELHPA